MVNATQIKFNNLLTNYYLLFISSIAFLYIIKGSNNCPSFFYLLDVTVTFKNKIQS